MSYPALSPDESVLYFGNATHTDAPPEAPPPAMSLGGITGIAPGAHQVVSAALEPGNCAMFCFFPDPASHAPHFALGMVVEFTVE